jgi:hypothetical protein
MKLWSLALLLPSLSLAAPAVIHLHPPANPNQGLFGQDTLCHVQGQSADGNWAGVCRYVGYRGVYQYADVEWNDSGVGTYLQPCREAWDTRIAVAGLPVCPAPTFGSFEYIVVNGQSTGAYVQGVDAAGLTAIILAGGTGPNVSALITP